MKLKFQADSDLNERIVRGFVRRNSSIDIWTAREGGLIDLPDPEVLRLAAESGRLLVSQDENTMPGHFFEFLRRHSSPGVLIVPQRVSIGMAIEELCLVWEASDADEWRNRLDFIPI